MSGSQEDFAQIRATAREIFLQALGECGVGDAIAGNVEVSRGLLRVCEDLYDLRTYSRIFVVAIGKASRGMAEALQHQMGSGLAGILVQPETYTAAPMLAGFRHFNGGHPTPNAASFAAASAVLKWMRTQAENAFVIYLLSGGGSAMLEKPLDDALTLEDLGATHGALVHSGAPIAEINAVRKHLSAVKGGRLAETAEKGGAAQQVSIMISDVPDSAPDALASGPTMPDSTTADDCYEIAARYQLLPALPPPVRELFERKALEETPKMESGAFKHSRWWTVLSNTSLQKAAAAAAASAGFAVELDNSCDDWDYARAADHLLNRLRQLRQGVSRVCLISGGEVTVKVPQACRPGAGGRNQHFALYCATRIAGENIAVLSAGSDGIDGNSTAAGAVADGGTLERARRMNCDPEAALAGFDSFSVFQKLQDEIATGATGNNIRDLRVLLAW